jgi:hypothetical protein
LEEAKKIEEILKQQLSEKKARCESLEQEVVKMRKEMEKFQALYNQNLSSIKASEGLTTIMNQQRNPKLKTGLGYEEGSSSGKPGNEEPIKLFKSTTNDNNNLAETKEDNQLPKSSKVKDARSESVEQRSNVLTAERRHQSGRNRFSQRRQPFSRYKEFFYGYYFYCANFGHKVVNCSLRLRHEQLRFQRNKYLPQQRMMQPSNKPSLIANCQIKSRDMQLKRSRNNQQSMSGQRCTNNFDMLNNEIECYICHNYGHKSIDFYLKEYEPDSKSPAENVKFWNKKESDKCGLVLSAQRKMKPWYIDSGCSKHMTGDKGKFLSLSESKSGNVTFGNDAPGKIKGKAMVSLSNGKLKSQDVLLVDGLKHNLLSVSQMCDRGCEVLFTSNDCKIKSVNSGQVVAKGIRTKNNVYVLKENREECHLRKHDESWLWHRRLGNINFDHLIKLKNLEAVKNLLRISKPQDSMCKSCQVGKQNRTQFKSKRFTSTEKPLQLVHMDLCGPSRQEGTGKENYFMLIIDDYSRLTWIAFLKFKIFKALIETQTGKRLKAVRLDRGGEFMSRDFKEFCDEHGIKREYTIPRTPQQNGFVERQNRTVQEMARSMMNEKNIGQTYWVEAIHTVVHVLNKAHLRPQSDKTPYELWLGRPASIKHFKVFGSKCYMKIMMRTSENMMTGLMKVSS